MRHEVWLPEEWHSQVRLRWKISPGLGVASTNVRRGYDRVFAETRRFNGGSFRFCRRRRKRDATVAKEQ